MALVSFPKSHSISKAIDKAAGAEREVVGVKHITGNVETRQNFGAGDRSNGQGMGFKPGEIPITAPATEAAARWDGFGTNLKPSFEPVVCAMKPLDRSPWIIELTPEILDEWEAVQHDYE